MEDSLADVATGMASSSAPTPTEPNPFFEPDFVLPASRQLPASSQPALVVAGRGSSIQACLPVLLEPRWRKVPLRCVTTRPTLSPQLHRTGLGTPLVDAGEPLEALGFLIDVVREQAGRHGRSFLALEVLSADGPVERCLREVLDDRGL